MAAAAMLTSILVGCADKLDRASAPQTVQVIAAGDIANCQSRPVAESAAMATAELIAARPSAALLTLGDHVYEAGSAAQFQNCYGPTWGRFRDRTFPSPGNHDYATPGADGYFTFFGDAAGPARRGYYAFDLGAWHIVSLNSNAGAARGSAQERWLRADLAANRAKRCILAYWHHAVFSSSTLHGSDPKMTDIWMTLQEFGADVILQGHNHNYERFAPQSAAGVMDTAHGIRSFVVGTGGASLYEFASPRANSEVRIANQFGVLALTLGGDFYEWEFLPVVAEGSRDRGKANCS